MTEAGVQSHPWATGTWLACVERITQLVAALSPEEALERIDDALESLPCRDSAGQYRRERLRLIARHCQTEVGQAMNQGEAERDDRLAESLAAIGRIARLLPSLASDDRLGSLFEGQVTLIRAVAPEDIRSIYALSDQAATAHDIAMALVFLAARDDRFDDYRLSVLIGNIHSETHQGDAEGFYHFCLVSLVYLAQSHAVSDHDAQSRTDAVRRLADMLAPHRVALPPELREAVNELSANPVFDVEPFPLTYQDTVRRLTHLYERTNNVDYLIELNTFCAGARADENAYQTALRRTDHAECLWKLGTARGDPNELLEAGEVQITAARDAHPTDPRRVHYHTLAAARWFTVLSRRAQPVSSALSSITSLLPPLPRMETQTDEYLAAAYLMRASVELHCAAEQTESDPEIAASLFSNVRACCEAVKELHSDDDRAPVLRSAKAISLCANVAAALARGDSPAPHIEEFVGYVSNPTNDPIVYGYATSLALTLAADPSIRKKLIASLVHQADAEATKGESYAINIVHFSWLRAALAVAQRQLSASDTAIKDNALWLVAYHLGTVAAIVGLRPSAAHGGREYVSGAILLARSAAMELVRAGDAETAAGLFQQSSSLALGRATRSGWSHDPIMQSAVRNQMERHSMCTSVIVASAAEETAVLTRCCDEQWAARDCGGSSALEALSSTNWPSLAEPGGLFKLMDRIETVARGVEDIAAGSVARVEVRSDGAILAGVCGDSLIFPSALLCVAACVNEAPTVLVAGELTDSAGEAARHPLPSGARIAVLVGRRELLGGDGIDVQRDIEAIRATGLRVTTVETEFGAVASAVVGAAAIHYSGHLFRDNPYDTALLFADGSRLSLDRIRALQLFETQVVTLIGCESGAETSAAIEEMAHAAGAFLSAGVGLVVATLWPVLDKPAHLFVEAFYSSISLGLTIWDSYRRGVDAVRLHRVGSVEPYAHPVFWGSFTLFSGPGTLEAAAARDSVRSRVDAVDL